MKGGEKLKDLEFYELKDYYDSLENDVQMTVRMPKALRDEFNKHTSNSAKTARELFIRFIVDKKKKN